MIYYLLIGLVTFFTLVVVAVYNKMFNPLYRHESQLSQPSSLSPSIITKKGTFFIVILVNTVILLSLYLLSILFPGQFIIDSPSSMIKPAISAANSRYISQIGESVFSGRPPF